jgi:molybdate transport system ATP-binding protein
MKFDIKADIRRPNGFVLQAEFRCEAQALAVVGPSGSGKSTLLEAIAGIESADRMMLDDRDLTHVPLHERRIGYVTQDALLFPHLSVRDNLLYSPRAIDSEEVLEAFGLTKLIDRMPQHLSGGERRRVALARALLSRPSLLLLDEPFAGLDDPRRREAISFLRRILRNFTLPIMLVSHRADEVVGLTDRAVRLEAGRVAGVGSSLEVLRAGEIDIDNHLDG